VSFPVKNGLISLFRELEVPRDDERCWAVVGGHWCEMPRGVVSSSGTVQDGPPWVLVVGGGARSYPLLHALGCHTITRGPYALIHYIQLIADVLLQFFDSPSRVALFPRNLIGRVINFWAELAGNPCFFCEF
jgi:hypothetical protein